jgi:hypothetical protein
VLPPARCGCPGSTTWAFKDPHQGLQPAGIHRSRQLQAAAR